MIRIGFIINFNPAKSLGTFNFIINLIRSISLVDKKKIQPVLIINNNFDNKFFTYIKTLNTEIIKTNFFNENILQRIFNKILIILFGKSYIYDNFFKKINIQALSHSPLSLGKKSEINSYPWFPDFQYLHYPNNFSLLNRIFKKINIRFAATNATKIILSSRDSKKDLKKISKKAFKKSVVNSFVFNLINKAEILSLRKIKKKYNIKNNFFYLPNQYFIHKNHIVVLKALKELLKNKRNNEISVISTGFNNDHRHNDYYQKIKSYIKKNNLHKNYVYLGIVPFKDMMSLIYHSIALLNPSTFEGWSSSVEQAKSMGKKIILSNIDVHKEQIFNRAEYFSKNNFKQLSKILKKNWLKHNQSTEKKKIIYSYKFVENRVKNYALQYQKIILGN
jgi:hypothetical protein